MKIAELKQRWHERSTEFKRNNNYGSDNVFVCGIDASYDEHGMRVKRFKLRDAEKRARRDVRTRIFTPRNHLRLEAYFNT